MWCAPCYRVHPLDRFPVQPEIPEDEKDFHEIDKADEDRFVLGQGGDHLMGIPFSVICATIGI